jgi:hypothetical protein
MTPAAPDRPVNGVVWMTKTWNLKQNPFPTGGIARLGGDDDRENGLLFRPEVQQENVTEAIEKFVLGAAYSGLKFGYLWSLGTGLAGGDARGYGKSSLLQYLVEKVNHDFGRDLLLECGMDADDAAENPVCAVLASFDMANARSLAAVFFEATRYACRFYVHDQPTLAERLHRRLVDRLGTDSPDALVEAVLEQNDAIRGRTLGPPIQDLIRLLCAGERLPLGRYIEDVKAGARARVGAANYLATFLLFAKAAGVSHVLLGCDQLEDFAATSTTKQKRTVETERFRDYVLELQPMADMLTVVVTLHPRAEQAIGEMWRLADLPSFAHDRVENDSHVVVLHEVNNAERARKLIQPYLDAARKDPADRGSIRPFTEDAIDVILSRSDGKPRDLLRKAFALVDQGATKNWEEITDARAADILDSLSFSDDDYVAPTGTARAPLEEQWT